MAVTDSFRLWKLTYVNARCDCAHGNSVPHAIIVRQDLTTRTHVFFTLFCVSCDRAGSYRGTFEEIDPVVRAILNHQKNARSVQ